MTGPRWAASPMTCDGRAGLGRTVGGRVNDDRMSWIEWVPSLLRAAPRRARDIVGVAFVAAVIFDPDAVVTFIRWLGEEMTRARVDELIESTRD